MSKEEKLELYQKALQKCMDYMIQEIEENWDDLTENGYGAERGMPDAETFLGHEVDNMDQDEIDEEVSAIQLAYYTERVAELDEVVEKFIHI